MLVVSRTRPPKDGFVGSMTLVGGDRSCTLGLIHGLRRKEGPFNVPDDGGRRKDLVKVKLLDYVLYGMAISRMAAGSR